MEGDSGLDSGLDQTYVDSGHVDLVLGPVDLILGSLDLHFEALDLVFKLLDLVPQLLKLVLGQVWIWGL